jgi:hypothetical protein
MKNQHIRSAELCLSVNITQQGIFYVRLDSRITDNSFMFVEPIIRHLYIHQINKFPTKENKLLFTNDLIYNLYIRSTKCN